MRIADEDKAKEAIIEILNNWIEGQFDDDQMERFGYEIVEAIKEA